MKKKIQTEQTVNRKLSGFRTARNLPIQIVFILLLLWHSKDTCPFATVKKQNGFAPPLKPNCWLRLLPYFPLCTQFLSFVSIHGKKMKMAQSGLLKPYWGPKDQSETCTIQYTELGQTFLFYLSFQQYLWWFWTL